MKTAKILRHFLLTRSREFKKLFLHHSPTFSVNNFLVKRLKKEFTFRSIQKPEQDTKIVHFSLSIKSHEPITRGNSEPTIRVYIGGSLSIKLIGKSRYNTKTMFLSAKKAFYQVFCTQKRSVLKDSIEF